jgi:16S rRNA (cytosine967-C5)-methyltransferase
LRRDPDFNDLLIVQQELVRHVADTMVKVGGVIVYATCSLLKQESEDQVTKLLSRADGTTIVAVSKRRDPWL